MLDSGVVYLDVAIGLAVAFFLLSLVPSGINEAIAFVTRIRSKFLWAYLNQLFTKAGSEGAPDSAANKAARFIPASDGSPVVPATTNDVSEAVSSSAARLAMGLPSTSWEMLRLMTAKGTRDPRPTLEGGVLGSAGQADSPQPIVAELHRRLGPIAAAAASRSPISPKGNQPTTTKHVPTRSLASALVDLLSGSGSMAADIGTKIGALAGTPIHSTLASLWTTTSGDLDKFRNEVEALFDAEMARLSGLYKRLMRWVLLVAALLVAMLVNLDVFGLTRDLWRDPDRRGQLVAVADD